MVIVFFVENFVNPAFKDLAFMALYFYFELSEKIYLDSFSIGKMVYSFVK